MEKQFRNISNIYKTVCSVRLGVKIIFERKRIEKQIQEENEYALESYFREKSQG